ncbi:MAG: hypothetical protein HC784_01180 [Hydrococcus sp. CSU_1_8]|nr:hypothetical protein [Hydrococcus sp. CSU_1_8]
MLLGEGNGTEGELNDGLGLSSTEFNNLQIMLGENIQLVRPPILNFLATGSLTLNGNLYQPRPQGKINAPQRSS